MVKDLIRNTKLSSSTMNSVSNQDVIDSINTYLIGEFITDVGPFISREIVSYISVSIDSDCFITNSTQSRLVSSLSNIASLKYSISKYTNKDPFSITNNIRSENSFGEVYTVQRESDFFMNGNISVVSEGVLNDRTPFTLQGSEMRSVSNYWCKADIKDSNDMLVESLVIKKHITSGFISSGGFSFFINYKERTLTVQKTSINSGDFRVIISSFVAQGASLIQDGVIFSSRTYIGLQEDLYVEAYVSPRLIYSADDTLDSTLKEHNRIIYLGTAKNLAIKIQENTVQESLIIIYDKELKRYNDRKINKNALKYINRRTGYDPLTTVGYGYSYGYEYGYGYYQ